MPWASSGVAVATDAASVPHLLARWLMARRPCSRWCSATASWETRSRSRAASTRAPGSQGRDRGCGPRRGLGGRAVRDAPPGLRQDRLDQPAAACAKGAPRQCTAQAGETTPPALILRRQDQDLSPLKTACCRASPTLSSARPLSSSTYGSRSSRASSGKSLADSGPPRTMAQLMLAHKKVS